MYIPSSRNSGVKEATIRPENADFEDLRHSRDDEEEECVPDFLRSKSNIQRMENAVEGYSQKAVDLMEGLKTQRDRNIIDKYTLLEVIEMQHNRSVGCITLPFSIVFFLLFASSSYLHEDITNVYLIESGLRMELGQGLEDVNTVNEVWDWIDGVLIPKMFNQRDMYGETLPQKEWSRVLLYNQLQGPVVLEQVRAERVRCANLTKTNGSMWFAPAMWCYPLKTDSVEDYGRNFSCAEVGAEVDGDACKYFQKSFRVEARAAEAEERRLRVMRQEHLAVLPTSSGSAETRFKANLYPSTEYAEIIQQTEYLRRRGWIDAQSKNMNVKALLLNAEVGRPRLENLNVIFSFSRGGGVHCRLTLESLFLLFSSGFMSNMVDFFWVIMLIFTTIKELRNIVRSIRNKTFRKSITKFWSVFEWTVIVLGWMMVFAYTVQSMLRGAVQKSLTEVTSLSEATHDEAFDVAEQQFLDTSATCIWFTTWFRLLISGYHLLLMFRFFTAFDAQPRLGVVTSTLESSLVDIIHFLIVLLPTFMAFAMSGCFIFGRRMEEFSTLDAAIGVCFKMAMEGEYDWPNLSEEHFVTAAFWVWSFMLLIVLLMLNMVLAIVMDVYTEMRRNSGQSETVVATFSQMTTRIYHWRKWVPTGELKGRVEEMARFINIDEIQVAFPRMCIQQLQALLKACHDQVELDSQRDMEMKDSMKMTMAVKLGIDKVSEEVREIQDGTFVEQLDVGTGHYAVSEQERGWLQEIAESMATQNHWMLTMQWQLQQLQWQWRSIQALHGPDGVAASAKKAVVVAVLDDDVVL